MRTATTLDQLALTDWLPPDFGAVGQYSLLFARQRAAGGARLVLAGLSSSGAGDEQDDASAGHLRIVRVHRPLYDRSRLVRRLLWTLTTNVALLWRVRRELLTADEILFTGSPPFLIHFLVPLNALLRKRLVYRITDFHPECLMAELGGGGPALRAFHALTVALRRHVDRFEVLGEDQRRRLLELGIDPDRIELRRDPAPVAIDPDAPPLERPAELRDRVVLLYSGNFGVAHDHETFVAGYRQHHREGSGRVVLWLNATGARADRVENELRDAGLPVHRSRPVPLEQVARLLVTPDAHLVTLRDTFVGYVLPSKIHACIASRRPVLYIGSAGSDVHLLALAAGGPYTRVDVGDVAGVAAFLEDLADASSHHESPSNR